MSEMIERVARAFAGLHIVTASGSVVRHTDIALAAIAAMYEPTSAMIEAADVPAQSNFHDPRMTWNAMITTALEETPS